MTLDKFLSFAMLDVDRIKGEFKANLLADRLREKMRHKDRILDLTDELYRFKDDPSSDGYFHNWHRRDSGQAYLAGLLISDIIPNLMDK
ncbi:hypothetical protein C4572_01985 [Candidatus Parcubacteria bacterium]|nr:MAG: hypothetical protein C4572_01985 [Candidatus Parcubacteria bacterium]